MTRRRTPGWVQVLLLAAVFGLIIVGASAALTDGFRADPDTDARTVERNGYLHGVRYADRVRDVDPVLAEWPRDELGVVAACRAYLDARESGFDRDAFLAGCADAAAAPR